MLSLTILFLTFIIKLLFYLVLASFVLIVTLVLAFKLVFEPVKGVCTCTTKLFGKTVLVTGGNAGLGLETARDLARRGARVVIASRDTEKSKRAVANITITTGNTQVEYRHLDLSKLSSVRRFAEEFNRNEPRLDILINNAGCGGVKQKLTEDGIDLCTQINYFGPFLLTNLLLDKLSTSTPSRIVVVSSVGHRLCTFDANDIICQKSIKVLGFWQIYARSKLLQILWTKALARRLPSGVTVNAVHPGLVATGMFSSLPVWFMSVVLAVVRALFKTAVEAAQMVVHVSVAPGLAHASGGYYADCSARRPRALVNDHSLQENIWKESLARTKSI